MRECRGGAERCHVMKDWTVVSFDDNTLVGFVERDGARLRFHSTSFASDTCFRWPVVGELVEVVTNQSGELLSVHGR